MLGLLGLTQLGVVHTAISLVAVAAGVIALVRYKEISPKNWIGKTYILMTVLTCLTGFGIFQHGGFGKPHQLGIITLVVIALAIVAGRTKLFGRASEYVETVSYSLTFFFHMIPGVTETTTRLPVGDPWVSSPESPVLQKVVGIMFGAFIVGAFVQCLRVWARKHQATAPA